MCSTVLPLVVGVSRRNTDMVSSSPVSGWYLITSLDGDKE